MYKRIPLKYKSWKKNNNLLVKYFIKKNIFENFQFAEAKKLKYLQINRYTFVNKKKLEKLYKMGI